MPLYTADALILRTYKLGEADRIVVFLTRDRGKKRGVAKGARRARSRFLGALEPLTEARVAYFEKERRELVGLNFAEPIRSPLGIVGGPPIVGGPKGPPLRTEGARTEGTRTDGARTDGDDASPSDRHADPPDGDASPTDRDASPTDRDASPTDRNVNRTDRRGGPSGPPAADALGYIGYFAELLDEWAQEADADERLYRLGASMLSALAAGAPVEPLARYFEYWLLRLQGVYPEARGTLSSDAAAFLSASRTVAPERIGDVPARAVILRELEHLHRGLITMHLEKTLKSDRVLRELRRRG